MIIIIIICSSESPYCMRGPPSYALGRNWSVNIIIIIIIIINSNVIVISIVIIIIIKLITREKRQSNHSD